jgi:hypothetical protein
MDFVKTEHLAKLNNCAHQFCGPCIIKWVEDSENKCPACKAAINKISYTTVTGEIKEVQIEDRQQDDNLDDTPYQCHACQEIIDEDCFE